jgi:hypothetical protein
MATKTYRKEANNPKKCPDCKRVYLNNHKAIDERTGISYLADFPSYGLKKESCNECEDKNG